ncbi:MAG: hypothetical protein AAGA56_07425, partial [Myxococcota bacterium]
GDADGTLWRLDLSSSEPNDWNVQLAFDAYPRTTDGFDDGQPISTTPVVSVDGLGNTVLLFTTGDQEDFTSDSIRGRAWSITEFPELVGSGSNAANYRIEANWVLGDAQVNGEFGPGEKVTGPIALFDGVAYFSTFTPPDTTAGTCEVGQGRVWGVDFLTPDEGTTGPRPLPRLPNSTGGFDLFEDLGTNGVPLGVAVTAEPSCTEEATVSDDFVGQHSTITQSVPPVYKLRYQSGTQGTREVGSNTNVGSITLPPPRSSTIIDSWASVVE